MSFSDNTETQILQYVANGTSATWSANANFWLAAHTADPGDAGTAVTSEAAYGSYTRVPFVRATDLSVTGNEMVNDILAQFPISTLGGGDITHLSLVTTASGAGIIIGRYTLTSPLPTAIGVQPQFPIASIVFTLN
jgi:hypothetical protein